MPTHPHLLNSKSNSMTVILYLVSLKLVILYGYQYQLLGNYSHAGMVDGLSLNCIRTQKIQSDIEIIDESLIPTFGLLL